MEVYDYQLIEFDDGSVDFVPNVWVFFEVSLGCFVAKFMPPPYDNKKFKSLNQLIRAKAPAEFLPVSGWPPYPIILIGQVSILFLFIYILGNRSFI